MNQNKLTKVMDIIKLILTPKNKRLLKSKSEFVN